MRLPKNNGFSHYLALAALLGATSLALADMEVAPPGATNNTETRTPKRWGQNERVAGEQVGERLIDRLLANARLTTEIGLTDETVAKLRDESHAIQARQSELAAQIGKLALEQTDHMSKLLMAADASTNEVMKTVEELGRLRTEQAKLAVQHLMIVRKYLTPEQIRKARELMRERMQKNNETRAAKKDKPVPSAGQPPPKPPEGW